MSTELKHSHPGGGQPRKHSLEQSTAGRPEAAPEDEGTLAGALLPRKNPQARDLALFDLAIDSKLRG